MVKSRSEEREYERGFQLGMANRDIMAKARAWCRHLSIEMESSGMLAAMTGLPIGSHVISCPHASGKTGGMNLPWALPSFVAEACLGCPHHAPNGDTSWGQEVLQTSARAKAEEAERRERAAARLEDLRRRMSDIPRSARRTAAFTEYQILEWVEQLFGDNDQAAGEAGRRLREGTQVAADLFGTAAVGALVEAARTEPFDQRCLPVLAELVSQRADLDQVLLPVAQELLLAGRHLEPASLIATTCFLREKTTPSPDLVAAVVAARNHYRPIGGWGIRHPDNPMVDIEPDYAASTRFLGLAYGLQPEIVLCPLREGMAYNSKIRRVNTAGVIKSLLPAYPQVGFALIDDILRSLELDDDIYEDSADQAATGLLAELFRLDPVAVDTLLSSRIPQATKELQSLYIDVYQHVTSKWDRGAATPDHDRVAAERAFQRCLTYLQDERLHIDALGDVPKVLEDVCEDYPDLALPAFPALLGTLAVLHTREAPAPPPRLLVPGEPPIPPAMVAMEARSRRMRWNQYRAAIRKAIGELAARRPGETLTDLVTSFTSVDSKTAPEFKMDLLDLIAKAGSGASHRPEVLPVLWKGLMDADSAGVRGAAIRAIGHSFRESQAPPPGDVVEILIAHLSDTFFVVHLAAAEVLASNADWLTPDQATAATHGVYRIITAHLSEEQLHIQELVRNLLSLTRYASNLREAAVRAVVNLLPRLSPPIQRLVVDVLAKRVSPAEPGAVVVAIPLVRDIIAEVRSPFDYHGAQHRTEQFLWLHQLPTCTFDAVSTELIEIARDTAVKDSLDGCLFASVFAAFGRYEVETELLELARSCLHEGKAHGEFRSVLANLSAAAKQNHNSRG